MNDVEWSNLHVPPNPEEEGFSEQTAEWLATHSKLAYSGFSDISEILKNHGYERVYFFRQGGANCYLTQSTLDGGRAVWVLSFRGTESDYNDILVDINLLQTHCRLQQGLSVSWWFSFKPTGVLGVLGCSGLHRKRRL